MKLSFRWYGEDDKVTLEQIRQIPGMDRNSCLRCTCWRSLEQRVNREVKEADRRCWSSL